MTRFRRRMRRLLDIIGGALIIGLWAVDVLLHPDPEDET